jgi:hypothetical protein
MAPTPRAPASTASATGNDNGRGHQGGRSGQDGNGDESAIRCDGATRTGASSAAAATACRFTTGSRSPRAARTGSTTSSSDAEPITHMVLRGDRKQSEATTPLFLQSRSGTPALVVWEKTARNSAAVGRMKKPEKCLRCGAGLEQAKTGRPRKFCSAECKSAWRRGCRNTFTRMGTTC